MWTLGFDTTASTVSAALLRDGELICHYSASSATTHSTTLLPAIEGLLNAAGIKARELGLICCSAGPGSFTGVRIGCATAKGLAAPFGTPCVGVSSLEAMASVFGRIKCIICPALNARRGNAYTAVFLSDGRGNITRLTSDDLIKVSDIPQLIYRCENESGIIAPKYVAGDSVKEILYAAEAADIHGLSCSPALLASPSGYGAALAGLKIFLDNSEDKALFSEEKLAPIYLRKSQAEREKDEKNNNL
ncbi:MAG: tRNA (adenosine(37)-N6)-threonylcarbamoyltransferase complex dimerization subunit type 1 TsaB [Clostridia bacterium]|nr:tRNA (adenosine(37)-N6)-threonylcarbamoyltransferase complex dimerization subunit type 1 TsaB [Clostridia bacterium]